MLCDSVLIEGVKYNAEKPNMIAKTFLRLERDFDKHVTYCRDEPLAQEFLAEREEVRNYFKVSEQLTQRQFILLSIHSKLAIVKNVDLHQMMGAIYKKTAILHVY